MRYWIDGIKYYLSCMLLFNVIFLIKLFLDYEGVLNSTAGTVLVLMMSFCISIGLFFTGIICISDHSERNEATLGKEFKVVSIQDLTGESYFANFSLIVLTGLSLPTKPCWESISILVLVEIALAIVYINNGMYYMNPVLSLLDYKLYKCRGKNPNTNKEYSGDYFFLIKGRKVSNGDLLVYKNISSRIVRLKYKNE